MNVQLLTKQHLEFLSLKEAVQACLSRHLSKCHIVGNHMLCRPSYAFAQSDKCILLFALWKVLVQQLNTLTSKFLIF